MQIGLGQQICESANLRFLEVSQIRRFADWLGLQICESAFSREKRRFQICESAFSREKRRFADLQIGWGLICESAFSREKRRFADLQIGWGLQICKSAFSRGNADSQICRLIGWGYKSANLRIGDLRRGFFFLGGYHIYIYIYMVPPPQNLPFHTLFYVETLCL